MFLEKAWVKMLNLIFLEKAWVKMLNLIFFLGAAVQNTDRNGLSI